MLWIEKRCLFVKKKKTKKHMNKGRDDIYIFLFFSPYLNLFEARACLALKFFYFFSHFIKGLFLLSVFL